MFIKSLSASLKFLFTILLVIFVASCGTGSSGGGENDVTPKNGNTPVEPKNTTSSSDTKDYNGTPPDTDDVQNFRKYLWSNIASESRCGQCHIDGGNAANYPFARDDNINLAYDAVMADSSYINLGSPDNSYLANFVQESEHNCWLGNTAINYRDCRDEIVEYIEAWSQANAPSSFLAALKRFGTEKTEIKEGKQFSSSAPVGFNNLHSTLQTYCANCHAPESGTRQQPFFASSDVDVAYQAIQSKVDINEPTNSRLYVRLKEESHNCWDDCAADAAIILADIDTLLNDFDSQELSSDLKAVASGGIELIKDGFILSNGQRVENDLVAQWKFTEGGGVTAESSGPDGKIILSLTGDIEWLGAGGVIINEGKLQALETAQSRQIFNAIKSTGEYSIEAWITPLNVTQGEDLDMPATIVSYSATTERRNFMLSQQLYNYNFYNRNTLSGEVTDQNGLPFLATPTALEIAQAALQHVVATFDAVEGRKIYVDGELVIEEPDSELVGNFNEWEDDFTLVVGNEVSGDRPWQGTMRLLAIHNAALAADEVKTNFDIGVGDTYYLMFPISDLIDIADSYIVFQVEEFDNYSYLFSNPIFYVKNENANINGIKVKGLRIGINTREAESGQAYVNIDTAIDPNDLDLFTLEEGNGGMQALSSIGTIIPKELGSSGSNVDQFFLTFDEIDVNTYSRPTVTYEEPEVVADNSEQAEIGLKNFAEINASLAALTGISSANEQVATTYEAVKQQLPSEENIEGFVAAHQLGITQLAVSYCNELTEQEAAAESPSFYGAFVFDDSPNDDNKNNINVATAFDTEGRLEIINPILDSLLANTVSTEDQPDYADSQSILDGLITDLIDTCNADDNCDSDFERVASMVTAVCTAAFGSSLMLLQ